MIYGKIDGLGKSISRIILGGSNLRSDRCESDKCMKIYDTAFENGINTYDTAVIYGDSECVIGNWINERIKADSGFREKIVVISKGAHYNAFRNRLTTYDILTDFHDSLARTGLSYIDVYLLHRDDPDYPVEPIIDTLNQLHNEGKVKIFGVSNWTHRRIEEANNYAAKHNLEPIRVSSPNFTLGKLNKNFFQDDDVSLCGNSEALEWYEQTNIPVFAWSSLARGFFAGRIKSSEKADAENILKPYLCEIIANDGNFEILSELEKQASEENCTVMQAALKSLTSQPFPVYPIFSTSNPEHIIEAAASFQMQ